MKNIIKKISVAVFTVALSVAGVSTLAVATPAYAEPKKSNSGSFSLQDGMNAAKTDDQQSNLFGDTGIFTTIVRVLLFLIGVVSVIMLIYGGIQYVLSTGDSGKVTNAKNTILYAIVGLIVAILSYAIVNFVLTSINGDK